MKRTIIGGILMLSGILTNLFIIMAAAIYAPMLRHGVAQNFGLLFLVQNNMGIK